MDRSTDRPVRIGLLCSELFDPRLGGYGGFGAAALRLVDLLRGSDPDGVAITALLPDPRFDGAPLSIHDLPVVVGSRSLPSDLRRFRGVELDVIIAVDWQPRFLVPLAAHPRVPVLLWMRNPRPQSEWDLVRTAHLPGAPAPAPRDPAHRDVPRQRPSMTVLRRSAAITGRRLRFAIPTLGLADRFEELYGFGPEPLLELGTPLAPVPAPSRDPQDGDAPHCVFIGRLAGVKRPWVFWALADAHPAWRFTAIGDARGEHDWTPPRSGPPNLERIPHADESTKAAVLGDADVLVSTSVHEGLPLSVCEALAHGVAVVSTTDVAGVAARFGEAVPNQPGDGMGLVGPLGDAVRRLVDDPARRKDIAEAGPAWVRSIHAPGPVLEVLAEAFDGLAEPGLAARCRALGADQ